MSAMEQVKQKLMAGEFDAALKSVYVYDNVLAEQRARYAKIMDDFVAQYGDESRSVGLYTAPGRTEICGNHTDHNHGKVLAASVNLDAIAAAAPNGEHTVRVKSAGFDIDIVDIDDLNVHQDEMGHSAALIRGICARFVQLGYKIGGFDATTASRVLSGSGLSSSAAFEVLICTILNHMFNDGKIDSVELAKISQYAENVYFFKPCGLLDQTACSVGGFVEIDFANPEKPVIEKIDFDFAACNHALCIVDTGGSHSNLTEDYAAVRSEMEAVAGEFGRKVLNEVPEQEFFDAIPRLREKLGERAVLRAMHFYGENKRVDSDAVALRAGDFEQFKRNVVESGYSSYMYNQNVYTPKAPTEQPVSLGLAISEKLLKGKGAWRVHGGGFAGTIQAFVPMEMLDAYTTEMKKVFGENSCYVLNIRPVGGAKIVDAQ